VVVDKTVRELKVEFKNGLKDKCEVGAALVRYRSCLDSAYANNIHQAAEAAVTTSDGFAAGMHWGTYRASKHSIRFHRPSHVFKQCLALRRFGTFRRDLNEELILPMTKTIASSWSKVFEADLFSTFETSIIGSINKLVTDIEASAATGLKDRVRSQGEACLEEAKAALKNIVEVVRETMNSEQKEVSRCLVPHIQERLSDGYHAAMEERGRGSVARQKVNRFPSKSVEK
jgi:hypothetical protein